MDENLNGLQAILQLNHVENSILVTARNEEGKIQKDCSIQGIKLLPKSMIEFVEINNIKPFIVLIDDDRMVHIDWFNYFKNLDLNLKSFYSIDDFMVKKNNIPKDSFIFIDSNLGNGIKGETESEKIYLSGYNNIYISSGHDKSYLTKTKWVIDIFSKDPKANLNSILN